MKSLADSTKFLCIVYPSLWEIRLLTWIILLWWNKLVLISLSFGLNSPHLESSGPKPHILHRFSTDRTGLVLVWGPQNQTPWSELTHFDRRIIMCHQTWHKKTFLHSLNKVKLRVRGSTEDWALLKNSISSWHDVACDTKCLLILWYWIYHTPFGAAWFVP